MITISTTPRMTLNGLLSYNPALFDGLTLPVELDKNTFVSNLLFDYGDSPVTYPNPDYMANAIKIWSDSEQQNFKMLVKTMLEDYDPLSNNNYYETRTFSYEENENEKIDSVQETAQTNTGTDENTVSAYNSDTYQPDNKTDREFSGNINNTGNSNRDIAISKKENETKHYYGNSNKTFSELQESSLNMYVNNNIYNIIGKMFREKFLLYLF